MFWQTKVSSPHMEALLNSKNCTIYDLMDDEDILQECKSQNKKLLEFLTRPNVMDELITLITQNPITDVAESQRYKYPHIACEILSCDIPVLNEKLAGDVGLLEKLYSFIDTEEPLNPLLASFFSKTMGILVVRSKDQNWYSYQFTCLQVLAFLKNREKCIDLLLYHLETSAIMNLVLKLVTEVEGAETRQNVLDWLDSQELVQRLVKLLSPQSQPSRHSNAAELLCDMIDGVREIRKNFSERTVVPDPILCTFESEETTTLLLDTFLGEEKLESSIVGGIEVLLTLLKPKTNGNTGDQNRSLSKSEEAAENAIKLKISNATIPYLEKFHDLLLNPPYMPPVKTTVEVIEVPVGNTRLHVLKLFATLLSMENPNIRAKMVELDVFQTFLDLFFKYRWNNFLHTQVQNALAEALGTVYPESDKDFYEYLFVKCRLINKLLDAYVEHIIVKKDQVGYTGHIIEITKDIVSQCEKNNVLNTFITTNLPQEILIRWQELVSMELEFMKSTQQILSSPRHMCEGDILFNYPQYMYAPSNREAESDYIDMYDSRNEVYKDDEGRILYDQSYSEMLNAEEQTKSEELFNKLCECREKSSFDDATGEESLQPEWMENKNKNIRDGTNWWLQENNIKLERSSSSEEEDDNEKDEEGGSSLDYWKTFSNVNVLQSANPWDINAPTQSETDNWANFTSTWPGETEMQSNVQVPMGEKVPEVDWACFANFESTLAFSSDDNPAQAPKVQEEQVQQQEQQMHQEPEIRQEQEVRQEQEDEEMQPVQQMQQDEQVEEVQPEQQVQQEQPMQEEKQEHEEQVASQVPQVVEDVVAEKKDNSNEGVVEQEQATTAIVEVLQTSDDDNANPIVMLENRISDITIEDKSCEEIVQNTVEIVNSSSVSSTLANTIENTAETVNKST